MTLLPLQSICLRRMIKTRWAGQETGFYTDEILKCLDSTEDQPDYVYTISVQGHGAYPEEPELEEHEITVTGAGVLCPSYQVNLSNTYVLPVTSFSYVLLRLTW